MSRTGRTLRAVRLGVLDALDRLTHKLTHRAHPDDHRICVEYDDAYLARIAHGDVTVDWLDGNKLTRGPR